MTTSKPIDIEKRVGQYVALRDKIKAEDDAHKERMKPARALLEQLNGALLQHLIDIGAENVRTASGTVSRRMERSASLSDPDAFMRFVIGNEAWDLLDRKANKTAVFDFIEENKEAPPGVSTSVTYVVGVQRK